MKFLSPDSGFMRGLSDAVDAIWINILMLVTSIPIITIGAALTAGHDAVRRTLSGEGTATRNYFRRLPLEFREVNRLLADFRHDRRAVRLLVDRAADHAAADSEIRVDDCVAHRFRMGVGVAGAVRELVLAHAWQRFCVRREQHRPHVGIGCDRRGVRGAARGQLGLHAAGPVPAAHTGVWHDADAAFADSRACLPQVHQQVIRHEKRD